jgi:hypothetical protein
MANVLKQVRRKNSGRLGSNISGWGYLADVGGVGHAVGLAVEVNSHTGSSRANPHRTRWPFSTTTLPSLITFSTRFTPKW